MKILKGILRFPLRVVKWLATAYFIVFLIVCFGGCLSAVSEFFDSGVQGVFSALADYWRLSDFPFIGGIISLVVMIAAGIIIEATFTKEEKEERERERDERKRREIAEQERRFRSKYPTRGSDFTGSSHVGDDFVWDHDELDAIQRAGGYDYDYGASDDSDWRDWE